MLPDRVSNPGPLTYESGALPIALRGPAPLQAGFEPRTTRSVDQSAYLLRYQGGSPYSEETQNSSTTPFETIPITIILLIADMLEVATLLYLRL